MTKNLDYEPSEDLDLADDYDYVSDSDLENDEVAEYATKANDPAVGNQDSNVTVGNHNELAHHGKVVALRGVSYLTFQAVLMYLYTDEIDFAPFGSKANRELRIPELVSGEADTIPRPSPKSIYRIADMYDIPKLKDLALESVKSGVKLCDAIEETFSKFTSRYPEMIDLHVGNLASALLSPDSQDVQEQLNKKLRSFADGEIPHAADAFSALFGILARYRSSEPPPGIDNVNLQVKLKCTWVEGGNLKAPPHRRSMNIALIRSMHHGSFLDMEYRVRKKLVGANPFAPIYLPSSIFRDIRSKLDTLVRVYDTDVGEGGSEVDGDSDYEEDSTTCPMEARTDGSVQKGSIPGHDLLPGAFTTWKSLFLCLCFNEITFGPLKSQGTSSSSSSVTKSAGKTLVCSPKSFYRLAQPLGLNHLADLAFQDIAGKLTSGNIVLELFSRFTACDRRLIEKQSSLLTSVLKTPETTVAFQRHVLEVAGGMSPHSYDALKMTFGNTIDAIKQESKKIADEEKARKELMSRPTLTCKSNCGEVSFQDVNCGSRCPDCRRAFVCSRCKRQWGGTNVCEGCGQVFR